MKIYGESKPSIEAVLAHHGVKGMKWGQRKAEPTTGEIKAARRRQDIRARTANNAIDHLNNISGGKNEAAKKKAVLTYKKAVRDFETSEDRVTAAHITNGEKVTAALLTGPVGLVIIASNKSQVKRIAKQTDRARQGS